VLLFTCHEHIAQTFQALKVHVQTLPDGVGVPRNSPAEMLSDRSADVMPSAAASMTPTPAGSRGKSLPSPHTPAPPAKPGQATKDLWAA
jgi:hypothetical protein